MPRKIILDASVFLFSHKCKQILWFGHNLKAEVSEHLALYHFFVLKQTIKSRPAFCVCGVTNDVPRAPIIKNK